MTENDWQELTEERAAIMEYDGGLPREKALTRATEYVRLEKLKRASDRRETQSTLFESPNRQH